MPLVHNRAMFNHFCLKTPVNPSSKLPSPSYERWKNSNEEERKFNKKSELNCQSVKQKRSRSCSSRIDSSEVGKDLKLIQSFIDFYTNIPDFNELNHLSEKEFYSTLENLKLTQKKFCQKEDRSSRGQEDEPRGYCESASIVTSCTDDTFKSKHSNETFANSGSHCKSDKRSKKSSPKCFTSVNGLCTDDPMHYTTWNSTNNKDNENSSNSRSKGDVENKKQKHETKYKPAPVKQYSNSYLDSYLNIARGSQNVEYNSDEQEQYHLEDNFIQNNNFDSGSSSLLDNVWEKTSHQMTACDDYHDCEPYFDEFVLRDAHSLPCMSSYKPKNKKFVRPKVTVPKPFKLTTR